MFRGSMTALITPFRGEEVDFRAFDDLVEWQIAQGTHGLVVCGTTGESPTLTCEEHTSIVERSVALVKGRIPVIAGTGSNSTAKTIELTSHAKKAGADAALVVTPYYNKPTQEGLYAHYRAVAEAVDIPLIVYNIPGRSAVDLKNDTLMRLARIPSITGLKDSTGDIARLTDLIPKVGPDFCLLSGEDTTTGAFMEAGGHGAISVTSNVAPALCAQAHNLWQAGKKEDAAKIDARLMPLHKGLFTETSPAPVKYALSRMGFCTDNVRLPLVAASAPCRAALDKIMDELEITAPAPESRAKAHARG